MDLSFSFKAAAADRLAVLPGDVAASILAVAARQAGSSTARVQLILDAPVPLPDRFAPIEGSFNAAVARALAHWRAGRAPADPWGET